MRTVVTPKGLDFSLLLRQEQQEHKRMESLTPTPPRSILKSRSPTVLERPGRALSVNFRTEAPSKEIKIRSRHQTLQDQRLNIMRRNRRKVEASRELSQHCELSFLEIDIRLPSPEQKRENYRKLIREEMDRKYAKAWSWVNSKSFALARRPTSRYS